MFESLPEHFRSYGINTDVRALLLFQKAIHRGLVKTLGDVFNVFKAIVVKEPSLMAPYTKAFYDFFLGILI